MKLHGFTAVASSLMLRRNPPKHTLLAYSAEATASAAKAGRQASAFADRSRLWPTKVGGYPLLAFIHELTPVAFCVGG